MSALLTLMSLKGALSTRNVVSPGEPFLPALRYWNWAFCSEKSGPGLESKAADNVDLP